MLWMRRWTVRLCGEASARLHTIWHTLASGTASLPEVFIGKSRLECHLTDCSQTLRQKRCPFPRVDELTRVLVELDLGTTSMVHMSRVLGGHRARSCNKT